MTNRFTGISKIEFTLSNLLQETMTGLDPLRPLDVDEDAPNEW